MKMRDSNIEVIRGGTELLVKLLSDHYKEKGTCVCKACCELRIITNKITREKRLTTSLADLLQQLLTTDQISSYIKYLKNHLNTRVSTTNGVNPNSFWYTGSQF